MKKDAGDWKGTTRSEQTFTRKVTSYPKQKKWQKKKGEKGDH